MENLGKIFSKLQWHIKKVPIYYFRAKEEAKQAQEKMDKKMKEQAENERLAEEAKKQAQIQAIQSSLPPEPASCDRITKIKIRLPAGKILERKFEPDTALQTLLNFLFVEGYPSEEYKVLTIWPRREVNIRPYSLMLNFLCQSLIRILCFFLQLTTLDAKLTLSELGFKSQEIVIVEER